MDQKHAMLYPPLQQDTVERDRHLSASASIGLPTEAPPSYDVAMRSPVPSSSAGAPSALVGWSPSAPLTTPDYTASTSAAQPQFPYQQPAATTTLLPSVIVEQPMPQTQRPQMPPPQQQQLPTVLPPKLGPNPCAVTCPSCGTCKTTRMSYTPNSRTHLCALLLCLVGWCCCACCVPYCMNSCRTGNHYCAKCNTFLGAFNPREGRRLM